MIRAGKLRHPVSFEQRTVIKNTLGEPVDTWSEVFRTFCKIEKGQVDTVSDDDANIVISDLKITVRKTSDTNNVTTSHFRAKIDGAYYEIKEIDKYLSEREITVYISNYD